MNLCLTFFPNVGDGKKSKDILRPDIPGKSQESQKDAIDLVKEKGQIALSGIEDAVKPSQAEEGANNISSSTEEKSKEILEGRDEAVKLDKNDANSNEGEERPEVNNVPQKEKIETGNFESGNVIDENKEKLPEEEQPEEEIKMTKEESENLEDILKKDDAKLKGDTPEVKSDAEKAQEPDILKNNPSDPKNETKSEIKASEDSVNNTQDEIEVPDHDDYLLYLEEILKRIHREFYEKHAEGKNPDMKQIIPAVRKKVLAETNLVFSGLVPNNIPLERSRAYQVAISLGANVTQDLKKNTTHLVAVRPGTAKVLSSHTIIFILICLFYFFSAEQCIVFLFT